MANAMPVFQIRSRLQGPEAGQQSARRAEATLLEDLRLWICVPLCQPTHRASWVGLNFQALVNMSHLSFCLEHDNFYFIDLR